MSRYAVLLALLLCGSAQESSQSFGRFGTVQLYQPSAQPERVVLFLSGDGGWNAGVVDMARALAARDALVVGIDLPHYLREAARSSEPCLYPAGELELLSKFVQKALGRTHYTNPVLVGYSSGATLAYAALAQAPDGTFAGALSLGFCPDLPLQRPVCDGSGLASRLDTEHKRVIFAPETGREIPWIALQGTRDETCPAAATQAFAGQVHGGAVVMLPEVGHGFSVQKHWLPQLGDAFDQLAERSRPSVAATPVGVDDLPLVEIPAQGPSRNLLAVLLSGDGGWAGLDRALGGSLAGAGVSVVGFDSLRYFWSRRTPEQAARDLERVLDHYLSAWQRENVVLVGYSLGADVLPFMVNRLPERLRRRVRLVSLLGPSSSVEFEFHVTDWLRAADRPATLPVAPEVAKLRGQRMLCVYGTEETQSLCPSLPRGLANVQPLAGGHHFGGAYAAIAARILEEAAH